MKAEAEEKTERLLLKWKLRRRLFQFWRTLLQLPPSKQLEGVVEKKKVGEPDTPAPPP